MVKDSNLTFWNNLKSFVICKKLLNFEELDDETRKWMLVEFEQEENANNPYRSTRLNTVGQKAFGEIMKKAIVSGDIPSLSSDLSDSSLWNSTELSTRKTTTYEKKIDPGSTAKLLAHTEFTTWYTRGLARRLMEEHIDKCEIYRAELAKVPRCECTKFEGQSIKVKEIYDGHRAKYHPKPNYSAFSIPSGPFCHHTIRRLKKNDV